MFETSKAYRAAMLAMAIGYFLLIWATMHSLVEVPSQHLDQLLMRSLAEAVLLVGVCHFLVRPYLRLNLMGNSVSIPGALKAVCYLLLVSLVFFLISYGIGNLPFLRSTSVTQVQVMNAEGSFETGVSGLSILILGTAQSFAILVLWSITYLAWHYHDNKKALHSQVEEDRLIRLTSQLHPHFLFNTLNSIRALVFIDQDKAADMITSLSGLLRDQMSSHSSTESSFRADWRTAERYLEIESVRFDDRLLVSVDHDPEGMNQKLPPLTLLTLVENAIKHGVSGSDRPALIDIESGFSDHRSWYLKVRNTVYSKACSDGSQVGLRNVRRRLELMFGSGVIFRAGSKGDWFTVFMELPHVESAYRG
jgi:hypothetical protein